ncbi:hypothetical protein PMAYCL1PPCAC_28176, partial [Pristionchus mayeri]
LVEHPIADIQLTHHLLVLNQVERVASRSPDGRGVQLTGLVEEGSSDGVDVVEEDAVEAAVDSVVDVVHMADGSRLLTVLGDLLSGHCGVRHNVRNKCEG